MDVIIYILIGLVSGGLISLVGTGAGLVIIPALVFFAHFTEKMAVGTSLTLLLPPIGIFAAYEYWKHGDVSIKAGVFIIVGFLVSSYLMAKVAEHLPSATLEKIFGIVAIAIGIKMLL